MAQVSKASAMGWYWPKFTWSAHPSAVAAIVRSPGEESFDLISAPALFDSAIFAEGTSSRTDIHTSYRHC